MTIIQRLYITIKFDSNLLTKFRSAYWSQAIIRIHR